MGLRNGPEASHLFGVRKANLAFIKLEDLHVHIIGFETLTSKFPRLSYMIGLLISIFSSVEGSRKAPASVQHVCAHTHTYKASLVAQMVKNLPAMQETQVQSLGREDPLEKGMATHSIILAWKFPWIEEPGGLQSTGSKRVEHD